MTFYYPELSREIIGISFKAFNLAGRGLPEREYRRVMAVLFEDAGIQFREEIPVDLIVDGHKISRHIFDFVIEEKIVVELKVSPRFTLAHFDQVNAYLRSSGYKLGLLILFTRRGVRVKRLVNIQNRKK